MPYGLSFGDYKTYQLRKYYRTWIERTLMSAWKLPIGPNDALRILQFKDNLKTPAIEDPGRLPCAELQKGENGKMSRFQDKLACLLVMIRDLVQTWWECSKENPGRVEPLLVELDYVIEEWQWEIVIGDVIDGFNLELK